MSGGKIYAAMSAIMDEVGAVAKDKRNQQQGFNYRGVDDFYNALNSVMAKHKVFTTSEIMEKSREERPSKQGGVLAFTCLKIRYTFWAEDGSSVWSEVEGEGMDSGDKSSNKAMSVAHKYALLQAFCVPTQDMDDPDKEAHELGEGQQQRAREPSPGEVDARAKWVTGALEHISKITEAPAVKAWWDRNVAHIEALPKEQYDEIDRACSIQVGKLKPAPKNGNGSATRPTASAQGPQHDAALNDGVPF